MRERRDRGDEDPAQPARRARAADRRDRRRRGDRGRRAARARARARTRSPTSRASQLENVLDMLAGRYPSDEFAELRPRIVWDRTGGTIRARDGARRLAVTNAGTIPDRGLFGVFLVDGGGRVGELDEEMVYEARAGQTFLLGASTWRIEEITRDRVLVSPAPGLPGAVPFWKGEGVGRPYELGQKIGAASRELSALADDDGARRGCATSSMLDERAARNLLTFLREQADATGAVPVRPHDRGRALPRRDRRLARLHPVAVRRPRARAVGDGDRPRGCASRTASRRSRSGRTTGSRCTSPTPTRRRRSPTCCSTPGEVEDLVVAELGDTALFGARFRENAARALLIPRRRPGQRTPLWQQRLKAQSLLQVARRTARSRSCSRPTASACRTCSTCPRCAALLQGIQTRAARPRRGRDARARRRTRASLLFDYVATYMYEDDTPPAERRAQALSLDRDLLRELLGQEELRDLLDARRGRRGRAAAARRRRRTPDELHDKLRLRGDLRAGEYDPELAAPLLDERRAVVVRDRRRGAADRRRGRGPLPRRARRDAAVGPARRRSSRAGPSRCGSSCSASRRAAARSRPREANERFGRDVGGVLAELEREELLVRGELRPGGTEREWCDPDVLRRLRRASLAALRREVEPVEREALARFLPSWHGIDRRASLREALVPLQALAAAGGALGGRAAAAPRARLPARAPRRALRERRGRLGRRRPRPRRALLPRGRRRARPGRRARRAPEGEAHDAIRAALERGALFWLDLLDETGLADEEALPALWDLVWAGEVTNDAWTPLRAGRRFGVPKPERRPRRFSRRRVERRHGDRRAAGRAPSACSPAPSPTGARSPSSCSSGRGSSRATASAPRASPAATAPSTPSCARSRRSASAAAATSSRASAARSSPSAAPSSGCASCATRDEDAAAARARRRRPGAAVRRRAAVAEARGRARRARRRRVRRPRSAARPALYVERGGRTLVPLRDPDEAWLRPALARARRPRPRAAASSGSRSSASTASRSPRPRRCRCSSRPASSPGRGARF